MSQTTYSSKTPSRLIDVKKQVGLCAVHPAQYVHLRPSGSRHRATGCLPLPEFGPANPGLNLIRVLLFAALSIAFAVIIFTDELKQEWLKTVTAFILIIILSLVVLSATPLDTGAG